MLHIIHNKLDHSLVFSTAVNCCRFFWLWRSKSCSCLWEDWEESWHSSAGRVKSIGSWGRRSEAQGGVQRALPLVKLWIRVLWQGRNGRGQGCCWSPPRSQEGAQQLHLGCAGPPCCPLFLAEHTRQDLSLTGHLWLGSLICRALFLGALGSMLFFASNRVLKVTWGVVCRARTTASFLRRLLACSRLLELLATFNEF